MKLLISLFVFSFSVISSAMASGDVLLTCAGRNESTRTYAIIDWRHSELTLTPKRRYLAFASGSPLLLAASRVNDDTVVTIKGGLFEFDRKAQKTLIVGWNTGTTAIARDGSGRFERVTCYLQHED